MIHHSTKHQQNSVTFILNMHSSSVAQTENSNLFNNTNLWNTQSSEELIPRTNDSKSLVKSNNHTIDGKSFTIAAILGLNNTNNNRNFNGVVNLSLNQTNRLFDSLESIPKIYNSVYRPNSAHDTYQSSGLALKDLVRNNLNTCYFLFRGVATNKWFFQA